MNVQSMNRSSTGVGTASLCRLCEAPITATFVDLGLSPLCESFVPPERMREMECFYPLHAFVCAECRLVQLEQQVSRESIFEEYAYFSSYSSSWVAHAKAYCEAMIARLQLDRHSMVVELASNDGYLLQHFLPSGIPVLGVEPAANVAKAAIDKGVPTRIDFFGRALAADMVFEGRKADLIIGNNVLAQVPDLNDFVGGMKMLLKEEGVITLEFPHIATLITFNQFDTIYHEHFSYFSMLTIRTMAHMHDLEVFDVEEIPTHGGSLRVFLTHAGNGLQVLPSVGALIERERAAGLDRIETYTAFAAAARRTKRDILSFLIEARNAGKTICGYGAPGKGNTLLNYCGIGTDFLDFTVDLNPYKHGRFTPGMRIPILSVEAIDAAKPDYVFILPWNLKDEIVAQMRHIGDWGGRFIVPIPHPHIIDPKEAQS